MSLRIIGCVPRMLVDRVVPLWLMWSCSGNKLFQGRFIEVMYGKPTLLVTLEWTLLNSCIALVGYYFAAFTIDLPWMGRWRMQGVHPCQLLPSASLLDLRLERQSGQCFALQA
jgi:hypothetical protein